MTLFEIDFGAVVMHVLKYRGGVASVRAGRDVRSSIVCRKTFSKSLRSLELTDDRQGY